MALRTENQSAEMSGGDDQWSGLDALAQTPEFVEMLHREFPDDATSWTDPVSRRQFLTLAGASVALAGIGCSPRPVAPDKIYPYARSQPEQMTMGLPLFFATGYTLSGVTTGVLVKSREGRPIKIEGNPSHPGSLGATDVFTQASILNMFDPERSHGSLRKGIETTFATAIAELKILCEQLKADGKTVRVLTETIGSPVLGDVLTKFITQFPKGEWIQYEPINRDNVREGAKLAFNEVVNTVYDLSKALRVVALDSDFLSSGPGSVRYAKDFNKLREVHVEEHDEGDGHFHYHSPKANEINRLYAFESMLTSTGSVADHHYAVRSSDIESVARALAKAVGVNVAESKLPEGVTADVIAAIAKDLKAFEGKCLVTAGDHQSPAVHAIVHNINAALKNLGKTVRLTAPTEVKPSNQTADFAKLVKEMQAGQVDALFIVGVNPAYTSPIDLDFKGALSKVRTKIHLGQRLDETGILCEWHINEAHYLETWGDGRGHDGTVTICQPLMAPLYEGHSALEVFNLLTGSERDAQHPREIVKAYWAGVDANKKPRWPQGTFSQAAWEKALQEGVVPGSASPVVAKDPTTAAIPAPKASNGSVELNFRADPTLYDGSFTNNGWMLELPKPITKLTWDNAIILSPKLAAKYGLKNGIESTGGGEHGRSVCDMAELKIGNRTLKAAVWIQPMHAEDSITIYLGSGRERAGKVGNGTGFNAYKLRTSENPWTVFGAEANRTGETYILACTQSHHQMEGRRPVRYATLAELSANLKEHAKDPHTALFAKVPKVAAPHWQDIDQTLPGNERREPHTHHPKEGEKEHKHDHRLTPLTLYPDTNKVGRRWAMAIDLTKCNGCGVCELACQAENNIPVVGKTQVNKGREMHWIRIDRYYEGKDPSDAANLSVHFQPVPCQQCEKAPCEVVCPVAATIHSEDGLNDMVYNRCVGTRYCSNNCPYKVRRFNFLTFADFKTEQFKLRNNPEVTVRERGVMEKCTYCVQRIRAAEIEAERRGVTSGDSQIKDGEIVTACEAACPASAIVFGDLNDPKSKVNLWKQQPTNYGLLAELNTMPRTTYLATIRNPNPELTKKGA